MSYAQKDMSGVLFKNNNKSADNSPDYTGRITIGNVEYRLSAWIKVAKSGDKFMSLAVSAKQ